MANNIIDNDGCYIKTVFTGQEGAYKLMGSESSGDTSYQDKDEHWKLRSVAKTIDTFKNLKTGAYRSVKRIEIFQLAELGKIK